MEKNKKLNICYILIALGFVFNICVFAPIELYYVNIIDLWFPLSVILPVIIIFSIILFLILFLILRFSNEKFKKVFSIILMALMICFYLQGNYFNIGYSSLDGTEIDWNSNSMILKEIENAIIWLIIIIVYVLIFEKFLSENNFWKTQSIISALIIAIEAMSLIIIIYITQQSLNTSNSGDKNYYLDQSKIFSLSDDENIVVFVSDSFESTYMTEILELYPEYEELLTDFTYFDNVTSISTMTFSTMPTLLTGVDLQIGYNLKENLAYCFGETSVYDVLQANNYTTELYTESVLIPTENAEVITNKVNNKILLSTSSKIKLTEKMYKLTLFRYMPNALKSPFYMYSSEINNIGNLEINRYIFDDVEFYNNLKQNGITTDYDTNSYKIYHLDGVHSPWITTSDVTYDETNEYYNEVSEDDRKLNEAIASINILLEYVENLKEAGIYDNTTIIFMADHGWNNRYYPVLIAKPANYEGDFEISHAPISLLEDFVPTILNASSNSKDYGKDIWDYSEDEERTRYVNNYTYTLEDNVYNVISRLTVATSSDASDIDNYEIVDEEYISSDNEINRKYEFGKEINFSNRKNLDLINVEGILVDYLKGAEYGYTTSNKVKIQLKTDKTSSDIMATLKINKIFYNDQNFTFYINGEEVYSTLLFEGDSDVTISFDISKEIWNSEDTVELIIELPNATLGDGDTLGEMTIYMAAWIESIIFDN